MSSKIGYRKDIVVDQGEYYAMAKQIDRLHKALDAAKNEPEILRALTYVRDGAMAGRTQRHAMGNTRRLLDRAGE